MSNNLEANKREEAWERLKVQQANQIAALQHFVNANTSRQQDVAAAAAGPASSTTAELLRSMENNESEHLLRGQDEEQLEQVPLLAQRIPQPAVAAQSARVNAKEHAGGNIGQTSAGNLQHYSDADDDADDDDEGYAVSTGQAAGKQYQYQAIKKMPENGSADGSPSTTAVATITPTTTTTNVTMPLKMATGPTTAGDNSKLDVQNMPEEVQQPAGNNWVVGGSDDTQQNGTMIVLAPTLLNVPAASAAISPFNFPANTTPSGNDNGDNEYKGPKIWQYIVRHWNVISTQLALLAIFLACWAAAYVLLPEHTKPNSVILRIAFLFVGAHVSGILVTFARLPDMLGMLGFGVLYTNVGLADFSGYQRFEAFLREMALINIMLLAGLGLDGNAFKRLWFMILRLTLLPTIAEVAVIAVLARFTLAMPWLWGVLLGLVVTAVSPNVVVTIMLKLKEERLGLNSGIHTLIYAMTTCNDVVAIFLFGVIIGVIYSTGTLTDQILQGPIGIGIGVVFGYLYGLMLRYLPSKNCSYVNGLRFVLTTLGGILSVMGSKFIGYPSAGALGCVAIAFVGGIGWKREEEHFTLAQQQAYVMGSVPKRLDLLWKFLKPVSFSLIGKEINFAVLEGKVVAYGVLLVLLGSLFRLVFAYISTYGGNLTRKERGYITISGFPKATVQAALGPIALDMARAMHSNDTTLSLATNVLIISVLAIIITAPLGAILMIRLAPVWLLRSDADVEDEAANAPPTAVTENSKKTH